MPVAHISGMSMALSTPSTPQPWHTRSTIETASDLQTDITHGLGSVEAAERLARHGPNTLAAASHASTLTILLHQFQSLMVRLIAFGGDALRSLRLKFPAFLWFFQVT